MTNCISCWRLRTEIKELKEIQKMLLKNMYHYEYRGRDAIVEVIQESDRADKAEAQLAALRLELELKEQKDPPK